MYTTRQDVFTLIIRPSNVPESEWTNPTATDLQHGLQERKGLSRTKRQIRRVLQDLEQLGLIRKENPFTPPHPLTPQERPARYEIVHPDRLHESRLRILATDKMKAEQERRRRKRKETEASHIAIGRAILGTISREHKEAGE
ncbi:hypothetical protein ES703_50471 [subsurface metagenome]